MSTVRDDHAINAECTSPHIHYIPLHSEQSYEFPNDSQATQNDMHNYSLESNKINDITEANKTTQTCAHRKRV